jgi:hypothetical protein|tara:strand:- start:380 stop:664 length:285 start_codon:yes stop_codon:yes gene_type:complete
MDFSFLDNETNKTVFPKKLLNAGIYKESDTDNFSGKPWGNNFLEPTVEPTSEAYASKFYAKNHIPSSFRPGNNPKPTRYEFIDTEKFNTKCFKI